MEKKILADAIKHRCSRRKYVQKELPQEIIDQLSASITAYNKNSELNMQLVLNQPEAFQGLRKSYGFFTGVQHYIALVGKKNQAHVQEKLGFFGELLVLEATELGLGTCWVGGTYDQKLCTCAVAADEQLYAVITIGYVPEEQSLREQLIMHGSHFHTKEIGKIYTIETQPPMWFFTSLEAVYKAPSTQNKKPTHIIYHLDNTITAAVDDLNAFEIDLGIAKAHFWLTAPKGYWQWGNQGQYLDFI